MCVCVQVRHRFTLLLSNIYLPIGAGILYIFNMKSGSRPSAWEVRHDYTPLVGRAKEQQAFRDVLSQLSDGENVILSWHHDYVHRSNVVDGQDYKSSSPERPITKLEKISSQEAGKTQEII